jgi:polysaccharide biosynthesis protein PslH
MHEELTSPMKILLLSTRIPAPEKKGDQVIAWFRATHLARTHQVEIVCFGDASNPDDLSAKQRLEEAGITVHLVRWTRSEAFLQLLRALPDPRMPLQSAWFRSSSFQRVAKETERRMAPDALYAVLIRILPNLDYEGRTLPLYIDMVDSMDLNFSRRAELAGGLKRWLLNIERSRVSRAERRAAAAARCSFVVSHIDRDAIGSEKVEVIPLGIDFERFKKKPSPKSSPVVVFTGTMSYQPNIDAVQWFVQHCWTAIKSAVPGVQLVIAGSNPNAAVSAHAQKDPAITVTGRVPSVAAIINSATIAIAPMQSGSGMQFKILEAMACAIPVVTTVLGLGDIDARPNKELLTADTSQEFSQAVIRLLSEKELATTIGENGMHYVHRNHNWNTLNQRFATTCHLTS